MARINIFLVLAGLPVVVIGVLVESSIFSYKLNQEIEARSSRSATALARHLETPMAVGDWTSIALLARFSIETGAIQGVSVRDSEGRVHFDYPCPNSGILKRSVDLVHEDKPAGTLDICFDLGFSAGAKRRHQARVGAGALIIFGALLAAFNFCFYLLLTQTRTGIVRAAKALSSGSPDLSMVRLPYTELEFLETILREVSSDVTQRIKELRRAEKFSRMLVESMTEGLAVVDQDGFFNFMNARMAEILGLKLGEVKDCSLQDFLELSDYLVFYRVATERRVGIVSRFELVWTGADRRKTPTIVSLVPVGEERDDYQGSLIVATDISEQKVVSARLIEHQSRLRHMSSALALAEERERRRIATEIHDNLSQGLALVQIKLDEIHSRAASRQQALELEFLVETVEQLNKDARSLMFELSPPILYEFGLLAALEWLADKVQEERGLRVYFVSEGERLSLSEDVSVLTFQVVRELIVNVIKHAQAKNVMIRVSTTTASARIIIEDDGVGRAGLRTENLSAASGASFGLFSIHERLEDIGARFEIESYVGKGTRAMIELPLTLGGDGEGGDRNGDRDETKNTAG